MIFSVLFTALEDIVNPGPMAATSTQLESDSAEEKQEKSLSSERKCFHCLLKMQATICGELMSCAYSLSSDFPPLLLSHLSDGNRCGLNLQPTRFKSIRVMIHPETQRGSSEVLKELEYQSLLLVLAGGSQVQRCKILRAWKVWFNCIQNDPLDLTIFYSRQSVLVR
ncbi:hypothetical protein ABVT39_013191 [Epinephelus coioides]